MWRFLQDYVYVYDGIPSFMTSSSSSSATLLAAYCGYGLDEPHSVEAKSGYLTIYFEGNIEPSMCTHASNIKLIIYTCVSTYSANNDKCLWIKARGLGQGWTRPAGRAPGRPTPRAAGPRAGSTWSSAQGSGTTLTQTKGFNPIISLFFLT